MQSRRDYAASLGLAKAGARGKFSNAAKEAIAAAEAKGMKFSDAVAGPKPVVKSGPETAKADSPTGKTAVREAGGQINSPYLFPSDFRFPEGEYVAVARDNNGKRVVHSMRECCNTCRVSLTNHACDNPTIHGTVTVKIERR